MPESISSSALSRTASGTGLSTPSCWMPTSTIAAVYVGSHNSHAACAASSATTAASIQA